MGAGGSELSLVHAVRRAEAADHPRRRRLRPGRRPRQRIPSGHPEGYLEGFAKIYTEAARAIFAKRKGKAVDAAVVYPTIDDGMKGMAFVDACVQSSKRNGAWVKV